MRILISGYWCVSLNNYHCWLNKHNQDLNNNVLEHYHVITFIAFYLFF